MKASLSKTTLFQTCRYITVAVLFAIFSAVLILPSNAVAADLIIGETYTLTVQKVNSDGSLAAASATTAAIADANKKIAFTFSSVPNNSSCNFLVVTVKDSGGTTQRQSIAPCPNAGESLPMGVSGLTNTQSEALLTALAAAGTDDPILVTFGFAITRSSGITSDELTYMATICNDGINASGGFIDYLTSNGVTSAQLISYRSNIVVRLANTSSGYSKLIKDSVTETTATAKLNARGEAASKLLLVLMQAATDAEFSQDRVLEAFNAMGTIVEPLMTAATPTELTDATKQMINSSIGGGIQKLKADKEIEKYSAALTTLGASGSDVTNYQAAATTLMDAMTAAFQAFEQVFTGSETDTEIATAEGILNTAMNTAFNQFMTDTAAATDADTSRIDTMITNIDTALAAAGEPASGFSASEFEYIQSDGTTVYWPLTMVVLVDWVSTTVTNGGSVSYTRDTTAVPDNNDWLGNCSSDGYFDKTSCEDPDQGNGIWTRERSDFSGMPDSYASLFGIQEDIEIFDFVRWAAQSAAGQDMSAHETLEKAFSDSVAGLASKIDGTTNGSLSISSTQKTAILTLLKSPQF